jgi:hypothetical protein
MANQSRMQKCRLRREKRLRVLDAADADRKAVEAPPATNNLWRQIDRWVNEGGAGDDGTVPSAPERIGNDRKLSMQLGSRSYW